MLTRSLPRLLAAVALLAGLAVTVAALGGATGRATDLPVRAYVPGLANDEFHVPATASPSPSPSPTTTPTTPSGNTVTLQSGQGFVFEPPAVAGGDSNDVAWYASLLVPGNGAGIQRIADFFGTGLPTDGYTYQLIAPKAGDVFALKLAPRGGTDYVPHAKVKVHEGSPSGGTLTFDWRYYPGEPCGGTHATITALDKAAEVVTVQGVGDMTGWKLVSAQPKPIPFSFPTGWVLAGSVQIKSSTAQFPPSPTQLWWSHLPTWDAGRNDDAQLYNCEGTLVQTFDDGQ